jgi:hypothetical protein
MYIDVNLLFIVIFFSFYNSRFTAINLLECFLHMHILKLLFFKFSVYIYTYALQFSDFCLVL